MNKLEDYYDPGITLRGTVDALSDPMLSHEMHRGDVNNLVLNLIIKYLGHYLDVGEDDVTQIRSAVLLKLKECAGEEGALVAAMHMLSAKGSPIDDDALAIQSVADLGATAAIFKEIMLDQNYRKDDRFVGVDLGTGVGILMLASYIAAKRREISNILVVGADVQKSLLQGADKVLGGILQRDEFRLEEVDLFEPGYWDRFAECPLHHWVSETISLDSPKMSVRKSGSLYVRKSRWEDNSRITNRYTDPFSQILINTMEERPDFIADVRNGNTAMFPDIANASFRSDLEKTALSLRTSLFSDRLRLDKIGCEFDCNYERFGQGQSRWVYDEEMDPLMAKTIRADIDRERQPERPGSDVKKRRSKNKAAAAARKKQMKKRKKKK